MNGHVPPTVPPNESLRPQAGRAHDPHVEPQRNTRVWPRYASIALGVWLFVSAFLWPHSEPSRANTWFVGVLIAAAGAWGLRDPAGRLLNTLVALWLGMSTLLIFPRAPLTFWNNLAVAVLVLLLSLVPSRSVGAQPERPARR